MDKPIKAKLERHLPSKWNKTDADYFHETKLSSYSSTYKTLARCMAHFDGRISRITRVECPYLYGWFLLKKAEYQSKGVDIRVSQLYHDTAERNISSILKTNLDWRMVNRHKFGQGVSFSPCTIYANRQSSRANGTARAMIVADVLVGNDRGGNACVTIPDDYWDTTTGNSLKVYVKFYDNEFYPKYIIYYNN